MKKFKYYLITLILSLTVIPTAKAANISVSTSSNFVVVGNNVTAYVNLSSDVEAWDFTVGYDTSRLRLVSSDLESTTHSVSTSTLHKRSYSLTFKAIASGTANIYISSADCASVTCSRGSKSITLKTQAEIEASYSKNNNLAALGIDGATLTPEFNAATTEYSVTLPPETTTVNVTASVADKTATIQGAGTREVTDGDNRLELIVTAQNGSTKTYVINAKVEEYNPIKVKVDNNEYTVVRKKSQLTAPNNYQETTVKINDEDIPAFTSEISGYTLVALKDEAGNQNFYVYDNGKYTLYKEFGFGKLTLYPLEMSKKDIPSGYTKTNIQYNDQDIIAYKLNKNSKYSLIYAMNIETGKKNIYMYDSKENTVQIYNTEEIDKLNEQIELYFYIIIGLSSLSLLLFILCIVFLFKKKNKKNNKSAKLIEDSIIEKTIDEEEFKRKELSKKEIRKKAREDKKAIKQEQKKMKKSFFTDND